MYRGIIQGEPNPGDWEAIPLVADTLGAWCPGATAELQQIARRFALREDRSASSACQELFHRLSFAIAQGVARVVIAAGTPAGVAVDEAEL